MQAGLHQPCRVDPALRVMAVAALRFGDHGGKSDCLTRLTR
jgi:hypothetical protein